MSWLLFMDESGHDHKKVPAEVRGGVAIHAGRLWDFVQGWWRAEEDIFGARLEDLGIEIKGRKLLEKNRFEWACNHPSLDDATRRRGVRRFLTKSRQQGKMSRLDFCAYGQASLLMADRIFDLLEECEAVLFASLIPRGVRPPPDFRYADYLRKDHVFLLERYFYFLERRKECGLVVMDRTDNKYDRRFVRRLQNYYRKTRTGRYRTAWVVPTPIFVDSELSLAVQAADLCLYCINWGFRLSSWRNIGATREEIRNRYERRLRNLQFEGEGYREGSVFRTFGIVLVPDPYTARN